VVDPDGRETSISDLERRAWWSRVAWVPQEPTLVAGTVADNVRWGAPDADASAIDRALALVGIAPGDPLLPDGAATLLAERSGVSAGQRRRIAVARALVRRADVLLLDEPTAGLDAATEEAVGRALRAEADRGAVVIAVAHRDRLLEVADARLTVHAAAHGPDAAPLADSTLPASAEAALVEAMTP
jgi:ABC-type transport system involved in cytochrome bd biosynthesis fused ATPase/permease subunit